MADSEEESPGGSEQVDYLWALEGAVRDARRKGDSERAELCERLAAGERRRRAAAGEPEEPAADYAVSLSSEGLSTGGVGSTPNSPRSPIASLATPEAYYENSERLEI